MGFHFFPQHWPPIHRNGIQTTTFGAISTFPTLKLLSLSKPGSIETQADLASIITMAPSRHTNSHTLMNMEPPWRSLQLRPTTFWISWLVSKWMVPLRTASSHRLSFPTVKTFNCPEPKTCLAWNATSSPTRKPLETNRTNTRCGFATRNPQNTPHRVNRFQFATKWKDSTACWALTTITATWITITTTTKTFPKKCLMLK